ncbi:MAG: carboxypeptidase regulatory-like domain-containing protein [Acidobacteriota bacterium]|nr:carboxypeptidase regulatory-like domain-containing protein [Acidobacteriota bacterium]
MFRPKRTTGSSLLRISAFAQRLPFRLAAIFAVALAFSALATARAAQITDAQKSAPQSAQIMGTVMDVNGDPVIGASVVLASPATGDPRSATTADSGFFQFDGLQPGVSYQVDITAQGFSAWASPVFTLGPGEIKMLGAVQLSLPTQVTTVRVSGDPIEIATQQMQVEETQRVFGIIPNFYVSYEGENAAPLTTGMKFRLALKVSHDPITIGGVALFAAINQAADTPDYRQGMKGYSERFSAAAADGLSDIMVGGAILPSLLHQDPRYFYQGTGSKASRLRHAMSAPFMCKGDNGKWQPNYSSIGGDLASSAISNLYYPPSNRGANFVFSSFAINTGERVVSSVLQEFVISKLTHRHTQAN